MRKDKKDRDFILLVSIAIMITLVSTYEIFMTLESQLTWIVSFPVFFILNIIVIVLFLSFFIGIFDYRNGIVMGSGILLLLMTINTIKYSYRYVFFVLQDILLIDEVMGIKSSFSIIKSLDLILISILIFLVVTYTAIKSGKKEVGYNTRIRLIILFLVNVFLIANIPGLKSQYLMDKGPWLNIVSELKSDPEEEMLTDKKANEIFEMIDPSMIIGDKEILEGKTIENPDVIFILSESFWDVNMLEGIEFNIDPMEDYYDVMEESQHGYLDIPVFGGGTANTEFEILTGISTQFYSSGVMAYESGIDNPVMNIASVLKQSGYQTATIHPSDNWFYNRREVYKYMGFDEFISIEYFNEANIRGSYVSDKVTTDKVIEKLESTNEDQFLQVITMQNHGPYFENRYSEEEFDVIMADCLPEELDDDSRIEIEYTLNNYAQGLYDSGKELKRLTEYLDTIEKPTIVLFYGDHLPWLGEGNLSYNTFNYLPQGYDWEESINKYYQTSPFLIWKNYDKTEKDLGIVEASFVMPNILSNTNLEIPNYYKYINTISKDYIAISKYFITTTEGDLYDNTSEEYIELSENLRIMRDTILENEENSLDDLSYWSLETENLNGELDNVIIDEIHIDYENNTAKIHGQNLYKNLKLYSNGENIAAEIAWISSNEIDLILSLDLSIVDLSDFQLKLIDNKDNILAESNMIKY